MASLKTLCLLLASISAIECETTKGSSGQTYKGAPKAVDYDVVSDPNSITNLALDKAIDWTVSQRHADYGWGSDTPHTVLALSLGRPDWFSRDSLDAKLVVKQFELELVLRLWKHKELPVKKGHLALNVMALVSLCRDPRSFYSKDLVAMVDHTEGSVDFEEAFAHLSTCISGKRLHKYQLRQLIDIMNDQSKIHSIDTLSVILLSFRCSQTQGRRSLSPFVSQGLNFLLQQQAEDGSFASNLHTTAIALQALIANGMSSAWNATKAQEYIMSHQLPDGSFGNIFDTNAVVPVLAGHTMLKAQQMPCTKLTQDFDPLMEVVDQKGSEEIEIEPAVPTSPLIDPFAEIEEPKYVNFTYILWIGNSAIQNRNMTFSVPENTTFFSVMQMAAEQDTHYEFSASKWANGYYVHTLAGQKEKQNGFWFWLLYRLREPPVPGTKPSNSLVVAEGVVELMPRDGDYILFWYHQI